MLVIDANVAVKWVVAEQDSSVADSLYRDAEAAGRQIFTPLHFNAEVANAVWRKVTRGLLTFDEGLAALAALQEYRTLGISPAGLLPRSFEVARALRYAAVYDCIYVAVAELVGCELWTADGGLANAAAAAGLSVRVRLLSTYSS